VSGAVEPRSALSSRWVSRPLPRPGAAVRLFCLPYAGAGTAAFHGWPQRLAGLTDVEVLPVSLPGREARLAEPPEVDLVELADAVTPLLDRPYALFGHSAGARLAFDLARELRERNEPEPRLLAVAGCPAPQLPVPTPEDSALDDDAFLHRVIGIGALPRVVLENHELRDLVLPALRADFAYVDTYCYRAGAPLAAAVHAFGGDRDPEAPPDSVRAWAHQTATAFRCSILGGDHFFVHSAAEEMFGLLAESLGTHRVRTRAAVR